MYRIDQQTYRYTPNGSFDKKEVWTQTAPVDNFAILVPNQSESDWLSSVNATKVSSLNTLKNFGTDLSKKVVTGISGIPG